MKNVSKDQTAISVIYIEGTTWRSWDPVGVFLTVDQLTRQSENIHKVCSACLDRLLQILGKRWVYVETHACPGVTIYLNSKGIPITLVTDRLLFRISHQIANMTQIRRGIICASELKCVYEKPYRLTLHLFSVFKGFSDVLTCSWTETSPLDYIPPLLIYMDME